MKESGSKGDRGRVELKEEEGGECVLRGHSVWYSFEIDPCLTGRLLPVYVYFIN